MGAACGPDIVNNGVVLHLDASSKKSYPGSGTSWGDLSGNNKNVTLTNSPTFSLESLGNIVFNGTNQYGSTSGVATASYMTISCWFRTSAQQTNKYIVCFSNNISLGNNGFDLCFQNTQIGSYARNSTTSVGTLYTTNYYDNLWHSITTTFDGTTHRFYYDGAQVASNALSGGLSIEATNTVGIGCFPGPFAYANCNLSQVLVYNRALTQAEVAQNFNATRGRFGI